MFGRIAKCAFIIILPASCLLADFSYQQTAKITGGMMAGMMKFAGAFSKTAREPIESTVLVKGDRMVHLSANRATIMDVAKETITDIDLQKKTYSVMTFAEMKAMLQQAAEKQKRKDAPEMNVTVSVDDTGQTRNINGVDTKEMILKILMETQDPKSGQKGGMTMTSDMWLAPKVAGYDEVIELQRRMAEKLGWTPGQNMFMQQPEIMKGMAEAAKQMGKVNGMPVYQVVKMGMQGQPQQAGEGAAPPPPQEQQQQPQQPAEKPSVGGALGGALGGRLGLGGLGRRKKPADDSQQAQTSQPAAASKPADASGALMEMTVESSGFSSAPVDASKLEVPAGFKQVQPDKNRGH